MINQVLEILRTEARTPVEVIARRLDTTPAEVQGAITKLEESKTILGYSAVIDPEKLDQEPCIGIIEVKLVPQRKRGYDSIADQIYRFPEVKLCYLLSGDYDLLLFVEAASMKSVASFITEQLAVIEHVQSTRTHFILKKYKEFGVVMGGDERSDRLAVAP